MGLTPIGADQAAEVAGWAQPGAETVRWCGLAEVTAETVAGWGAAADVLPYGLVEDGRLVGYGELWTDDDEVELARIIVAPDARGRRVGRRLATLLGAEAARLHPAVYLRVHPDNAPARRCYLGAGFVPVPAAEAAEWNRDQPVAYDWLQLPPTA